MPAEQRAALRAEVEEHLTDALAESGDTEATVTGILDGLGPPEGLVAEVAGYAGHPGRGRSGPWAGTAAEAGSPRLERVALALLVVSIACCVSVVLLPVAPLPWLVGSVLVLFSVRWSASDKALALVAYGILGVPFLFVTLTGLGGVGWSESCSGGSNPDGSTWETCSGGPPSWWWLVVASGALVLLTVWVATGIRLVRSMRRPEDHQRLLRMG